MYIVHTAQSYEKIIIMAIFNTFSPFKEKRKTYSDHRRTHVKAPVAVEHRYKCWRNSHHRNERSSQGYTNLCVFAVAAVVVAAVVCCGFVLKQLDSGDPYAEGVATCQ